MSFPKPLVLAHHRVDEESRDHLASSLATDCGGSWESGNLPVAGQIAWLLLRSWEYTISLHHSIWILEWICGFNMVQEQIDKKKHGIWSQLCWRLAWALAMFETTIYPASTSWARPWRSHHFHAPSSRVRPVRPEDGAGASKEDVEPCRTTRGCGPFSVRATL